MEEMVDSNLLATREKEKNIISAKMEIEDAVKSYPGRRGVNDLWIVLELSRNT